MHSIACSASFVLPAGRDAVRSMNSVVVAIADLFAVTGLPS